MSEQENAQESVENQKTAEELAESLRKAEAKIVELKKTATPVAEAEVKTEAPKNENFMTREDYEAEEFFKQNPDMLEYKDKLLSYYDTSRGIDLNKARILVENDDETIANRKVASQANFTAGEPAVNTPTYSREDLEKMNQDEYNKVKDLQEQGKVTITN